MFITSGQARAQVQLDIGHTQHWTFMVNSGLAKLRPMIFQKVDQSSVPPD